MSSEAAHTRPRRRTATNGARAISVCEVTFFLTALGNGFPQSTLAPKILPLWPTSQRTPLRTSVEIVSVVTIQS